MRTDRCRYTNTILSNRYNLVGKKLLLYIDRRDIRIACGSVVETGEMLGAMVPEARWSRRAYSLQERKLFNRTALAKTGEIDSDPIDMWRQEKAQTLRSERQSKKARARSSKAALLMA
ncbi:hypothetical protein PQR02_38675, partial [Paraburkholderia sediminicola]